MYLLELVQDNDVLASKLSKEVYWKDLSEVLDEIENEILNDQEVDVSLFSSSFAIWDHQRLGHLIFHFSIIVILSD